jgi:hypothetical protein
MKRTLKILSLVLISLFAFQQPLQLYAISQTDLEAITRNHPFYDPKASCTPSSSSNPSAPADSGKLFILGDSLGVGLMGTLGAALGSEWQVTGDVKESRFLNEGIAIANSQPEDLKTAQSILVVLGTNPDSKLNQEGINEMVTALNSANSGAHIYWLKVNVTDPDLVANATTFNGLLSSTQGITPIDNSAILSGDGVHPADYAALAADVAASITGSSVSTDGGESLSVSSNCGPCTTSGSTGVVPIDGENPKRMFEYLVGNGLTPEQAAGVTGNAMAESGENIDPSAANGNNYRGIFQWDTKDRWPRLVAWAEGKDKDPGLFEVQLEYAWIEAGERGNLNGLREQDSIELATWYWGRFFEVAIIDRSTSTTPLTNVQHLDKRTNFALSVFNKYSGSISTESASSSATCSGMGTGGIATVDGFTFPLKTTKSVITGGNEVGAKWCYKAQTNCHHDYNAADIMVPAGTIVIAAKAGEVIKASNSSGPCGSSVQIKEKVKDSDDQVYYYTHMANGSVSVTKGQQVSAGTVLGTVSANQHCNSSPHLHFDMPSPPLSYRPSCSGAGCNAYSFLEVQPVLTASYAALPE